MGLLNIVYGQFRKPTGVLGRVAGWIMANRPSNIERNRWTVDLLQIKGTDHVLEIGFGPGLSIAQVSRLAPRGHVTGVDHSRLMMAAATRRNRDAIRAGLVDLQYGGLERLQRIDDRFDKIFSVNVLQFLADRTDTLKILHSILKPNGVLATTLQPRQRGAKPEDADAFATTLSKELTDAGFRGVIVKKLALKPLPAVCVLGNA
jgi:ubiquinone/menaquinone biosynthesis C-methylase UbiE